VVTVRESFVDRLWRRGLSKDRADIDEWRKELAPSTALRRYYGHRPERFHEFTRRHQAELRQPDAASALAELTALATRRPVTASRDVRPPRRRSSSNSCGPASAGWRADVAARGP
jgi:uncharacterized protein YeaO (DUF488 family)